MPVLIPCSLSHSIVLPPSLLLSLSIQSKLFLLPPCHLPCSTLELFPTSLSCLLFHDFPLRPHLYIPACLPPAPRNISPTFRSHLQCLDFSLGPGSLQLIQMHFYVGLCSSPSFCLLTFLIKSSWSFRFLFSCSHHFSLSLHALICHIHHDVLECSSSKSKTLCCASLSY